MGKNSIMSSMWRRYGPVPGISSLLRRQTSEKCFCLPCLWKTHRKPGTGKNPGLCAHCATPLLTKGPANRGHCQCPACGTTNRYPDADLGAPRHRLFAMEYHCPKCKPSHTGRFFKAPDEIDLNRLDEIKTSLGWNAPGISPCR